MKYDELQQIIYEEIKKVLSESEWWRNRRGLDNKAYNINLGKKFRKMKHVKSGNPYRCNPPSKLAGGIKPTKGSKC
mgnify:FL=1|tara:strand:- start:281 stop:508 length:228 start_codon:yes stop_codon:yes gene_type:complete